MQPSRAPIIPSNGRAGDMRHATRATRLIFKKKEEKNSMTNDLFVENSSSSSSSSSVYSPLEPRRKILFFSLIVISFALQVFLFSFDLDSRRLSPLPARPLFVPFSTHVPRFRCSRQGRPKTRVVLPRTWENNARVIRRRLYRILHPSLPFQGI